MSNQIFPTLPGLAAERDCEPEFDNVVSRASSGRRYALGKRLYPVWRWNLRANFLRQRLGLAELDALQGFFLQRQGNLDSFLYRDREWNTVAAPQVFGQGDGVADRMRLVYNRGGFVDLVRYARNERITMDVGDWRGARQLYSVARTNLFPRSEEINGWASYWQQASSVSDAAAAPSGAMTADKIVEAASAGEHFADRYNGYGSAGVKVFSGYFHAAGRNVLLAMYSTGNNHAARFDLSTGVATPVTVGAEAGAVHIVGGWYRCWLKANISNAAGPIQRIACVNAANTTVYTGDGSSGVYVWGLQLEDSELTEYIPTAAAAVTAPADYALDDDGYVDFTTAPPLAAELAWTGEHLFRVAFSKPALSFKQFLKDLYSVDGISLESVNR